MTLRGKHCWRPIAVMGVVGHSGKFFITPTEFDKNISYWRYDCTDHKNAFDFFMRLDKWPKIAVKKCQILIFKVNFQRQKSDLQLQLHFCCQYHLMNYPDSRSCQIHHSLHHNLHQTLNIIISFSSRQRNLIKTF